MQDIKTDSSKWINKKGYTKHHFNWQDGYGAFSYGKSQLNNVIQYIQNQEQHHKKISFVDEFKSFLKLYDIEFDERYILKDPV
jgi:hypothetical protein